MVVVNERVYTMALYKAIREDIVQDILTGAYEPGQMIHGQEVYAKKFSVSRATVRKAIDELVDKKMLFTIKGKGTYVSENNRSKARSGRKLSFSESERVKTQQLTSKMIALYECEANRRVARQLGIALDDQVVCLKRLRMVNGIPENYQISYLNKELIKDIDFSKEDLDASFLFRLLREKARLVPKYSDEEIRAVVCPAEIAEKLGVEKNDPILFIRRTTYSQEGLVMEYCEDYECSDVKGLKIRTFA